LGKKASVVNKASHVQPGLESPEGELCVQKKNVSLNALNGAMVSYPIFR
jgi:hypothetical protein